MIPALVSALMRYELRSSFRRVCWMGERPALPPNSPVVMYANHHHYYDGHLMWLLTKFLDRPGLLWMAEWDQFPFFAAVGAHPFPADDPQRRAATIRRTARYFRSEPASALVYFPEGHLHRPSDGIQPLPNQAMQRLGHILPTAAWWPVAISVTWWGEARPTALLTGGTVTRDAPPDAHERLQTLWTNLRATPPEEARVLLEGRRRGSELWSFTVLRSIFERYL